MLLPDRCHAGAILIATTILFESPLRIDGRHVTTYRTTTTMGCSGFARRQHLVVARRGRSNGEDHKTWNMTASRVGCVDEAGATFTQTDLLSSSFSLELWVIGSSQHVHFVYVDAVLCR